MRKVIIMTWKDEIKKEKKDDGSTGRRSYTNKVRDTRSAESYKTGDTTGRPVNVEKMKLLPNAYKPLQKAILHLETIGDDVLDYAIDEARWEDYQAKSPFKSLDLNAQDVRSFLHVIKTALIRIYNESEKE